MRAKNGPGNANVVASKGGLQMFRAVDGRGDAGKLTDIALTRGAGLLVLREINRRSWGESLPRIFPSIKG